MTDTDYDDADEYNPQYDHPLIGPIARADDVAHEEYGRLADVYGDDTMEDLGDAMTELDRAWGNAVVHRCGEISALERVIEKHQRVTAVWVSLVPFAAFVAGVVVGGLLCGGGK